MINAMIAILALVVFLPITGLGQEKKVHVKTVSVVDGEEVVNDTIFFITDSEKGDVHKAITLISDGDSSGFITVDVDINRESIERLKEGLERYSDELENISIEIDGEKIVMFNELKGLEELKELEHLDVLMELDGLKNIEINIPDIPDFPEHFGYYVHKHHGYGFVDDKELRDAGIKNKPDRLDVNDFSLNIEDGIVDLDFTLKTDGTPKVTVFNYFGDKVFSGKPELMAGKYVIKIDLSNKQHGTYYLQVVLKNGSFTGKLRL